MKSAIRLYAPLLLLCALLATFFDLAKTYDGFRQYNGPPFGMALPPNEVLFYGYQALFAALLVPMVVAAVHSWKLALPIERAAAKALGSRWLLPALCLVLFSEILLVKDLALEGTVVSDDEHVYDFIAKTLLAGRVNNPAPASDTAFYQSTFVILREGSWYGKYPIGHPIVLALGELAHIRFLIIPLVAVASFWLTFVVAEVIVGRPRALLACVLLLLSPQFVMTAATELSQNTGMLALLAGLFYVLRAEQNAHATRYQLAAGALVGFGVLIRPLPGLLFALVLTALLVRRVEGSLATRLKRAAPFLAIAAALTSLLLVVNGLQSGNPFWSGYQEAHGGIYIGQYSEAATSNSLAGGLLRQAFWAFGGPLLALVPLALGSVDRSKLWPLWWLVFANYTYRILSPKLFVGTTGPVYLAEHVPLLAVLAAVGAGELYQRADRFANEGRAIVVGSLLGGAVACLTLFVPIELVALKRNAEVHRFVPDALAMTGSQKALVFATVLAPPGLGATWSLGPPAPDPRGQDGRILYARIAGDADEMHRFWKEHHADRAAYLYDFTQVGPRLVPLETAVAQAAAERAAAAEQTAATAAVPQ